MMSTIGGWATTNTGSSTATAKNQVTSVIESNSALVEYAKASGSEGSTQSISTLGRQLADSAARAEERDQTFSYKELAVKAKSLLGQISGDDYFRNKEKHNSEVPNTDDPELLARAKQATAFVNSTNPVSGSKKNPFAGLSNEQLSLVIYDDSGAYTINERRAAWSEAYDREQTWRQKVVGSAQSLAEYESTGKHTNFFKACIDHYKGLPLIEQVQYPENYVSLTTSMMNSEVDSRSYFAAHGKGKDDNTLYELLLGPTN